MSKGINGTRIDKTRYLVQLSMWTAITLILAFVPNLGYIPLGPFHHMTTVHIPVIIGAILLGPGAGAFLGFIFGLTSLIQATLQMPLTAFLYSPFVPFGNFWSAVIAIVPRVCIGIVAAYVYRLIKIKDKKGYVASLVAGVAGSLTNAILVLSGAYIFFGERYATVTGVPFKDLLFALLGVVATNGVIEAVAAAVLVTAVVKAITAAMKRL